MKKIENVQLSFHCPEKSESMNKCDDGYFCKVCEKKVYDFTDKDTDYFQSFLTQNEGEICGKFKKSQFLQENVLKYAASALIALSVNNIVNAQSTPQISQIEQVNHQEDETLGIIVTPQPEYPGGTKAMFSFLAKNLKYPKDAIDGKVFIKFLIDTKGKVQAPQILKGLKESQNNEVIRVVKLLKFKPAIQNNKAIATWYTFPIQFQKDEK